MSLLPKSLKPDCVDRLFALGGSSKEQLFFWCRFRSITSGLPLFSSTSSEPVSSDLIIGDEQNAGFLERPFDLHYCQNIVG